MVQPLSADPTKVSLEHSQTSVMNIFFENVVTRF